MLDVKNLSFSYRHISILRNFSLSLDKGEAATLIGCSGSGKTTLFRLLTGLIIPQMGQLSIDGDASADAHQNVAYMMQDDLLLPWRTVLENLSLIGELGKHPKQKNHLKEEALFYLNEMGLAGWENAYPDQLSGGMRQRVSLTRALLQKRPLLLLDEPFAALDVGMREQMHALLKNINQRHQTTILMVTHDFRDALSLSNRIFLLNNGKISNEWKVSEEIRENPVLFQTLYRTLSDSLRA